MNYSTLVVLEHLEKSITSVETGALALQILQVAKVHRYRLTSTIIGFKLNHRKELPLFCSFSHRIPTLIALLYIQTQWETYSC